MLLRRLIFETDRQYLSLQYKLKMRSLSSVWNENKHFWLVFMKMLVFVPKTRSLHTGTVLGVGAMGQVRAHTCIYTD